MLVDGWPSAGVGHVVVLGAQLDPGDVAHVDDRAGGPARRAGGRALGAPVLRMMSPNCLSVSSRPRALMVSWKGWPAGTGCWPTVPGGDLDVLVLDGGDDVRGRQAAAWPACTGRARGACCNRADPA